MVNCSCSNCDVTILHTNCLTLSKLASSVKLGHGLKLLIVEDC